LKLEQNIREKKSCFETQTKARKSNKESRGRLSLHGSTRSCSVSSPMIGLGGSGASSKFSLFCKRFIYFFGLFLYYLK
jgi:hypothetical protein